MYKAIIVAASSLTFASVSAHASQCISAPESLYTSINFSCNVDGFTFSNITVDVVTGGSATQNIIQILQSLTFDPVINAGGDAGLRLNYNVDIMSGVSGTLVDITWKYNVVAVPSMSFAGFAIDGTTSGSGLSQGAEVFSGITGLGLSSPGFTGQQFTPTFSAFVTTDQVTSFLSDFIPGTANTHSMTNTFAVTAPAGVPGPVAGTGIPSLLLACFGFFTWWRKNIKSSL